MHSAIHEEFTTTSQKSSFCLNVHSWGQLWPECGTPLQSTFEWAKHDGLCPAFFRDKWELPQMHAGAEQASLGTTKRLGLLMGGAGVCHQQGHTGTWCF